jgi:hypothetical protein
MDLLNLQSAVSPVSGTAASVGDCDDLEISFCDSVNYAVRKSPKKKFSRTVQVHRPSLGTVLDFIDGMIELGHKSNCRGGISLGIPPISSRCLCDGVRMEPSAWSGHWIAREFGGVRSTREPSLFSPCPTHRCGGRSPYSMPPRRLHRLSRPDSQLAGPQSRHAPRPVGEERPLGLFLELTS